MSDNPKTPEELNKLLAARRASIEEAARKQRDEFKATRSGPWAPSATIAKPRAPRKSKTVLPMRRLA